MNCSKFFPDFLSSLFLISRVPIPFFSMKTIPRLAIFRLTFASSFAADKALFKIKVQLDWVAEPEHGGFYQAQAKGFFREEGLDVTLIPGGPGAFVMPN